MEAFELEDDFLAVRAAEEESLLPELYSRVLAKFLKEGKIPWYCWVRSKDLKKYLIFNRTRFVRKLGEEGFDDFIDAFEEVIGPYPEWGFALYESRPGLLVVSAVKGTREKPEIAGAKIGKVQKGNGQLAVVEVSATNEQAMKLVKRLLSR